MSSVTTPQAALQLRKVRLGEQLVSAGAITPEQLQRALEYQKETRVFLGQALLSLGFSPPHMLGPHIARSLGFEYITLTEARINSEVARLVPEAYLRRKLVLPFAMRDQMVAVAMCDPLDVTTVDDIRARLNRRIVPYLAFEGDIQDAIGRIFDGRLKTQSVLEEISESPKEDGELSEDTLKDMAEDAPIVRLVNSIIQSAIASGTSDIHIEPQEKSVRVRFRQDGILYEQNVIPRTHLAALISRLKVMSSMNIAERRRPQDGRFVVHADNGTAYDMRVSAMPLLYGEKIVMRLLPKTNSFGDCRRLGFFPDQLTKFESCIKRPHGLILVTGPTGSGKSTTLFGALNQINDATTNINTVEDPVEYNLPGVNQMQVNHAIGVSFASGLRTLLRQDPDVVMVGEIRDLETAEIAIQAALTGHLVLSTLHTNNAVGAVTRLQNMGIEPFLISSALIGVVGQRLMRTICPGCKTERPLDRNAQELVKTLKNVPLPEHLYYGQGCQKCDGRGMKGRTAVHELLLMSETLRDMVLKRTPTTTMQEQAIQEGMMTMRDSGVRKALQGLTTTDEVIRVLFSEDA